MDSSNDEDEPNYMPPPRPMGGGVGTPTTARGGRRTGGDDEVPETPAGAASPDSQRMAETPSTPQSIQTELDSVVQGNNQAAQQNMEVEEDPAGGGGADELDAPYLGGNNGEAHIRGTDVHVPTAAAAFTDFLRNFVSLKASQKANRNTDDSDDDDDDDSLMSHDSDEETEPLYMKKLQSLIEMEIEGTASMEIDTIHLYYHSHACQRLYHQLVQFPMELVPLMDIIVKRELERMVQNNETPLPNVQVRPFNLKTVSNLRELDPVSMDSLVSCKGMIVRSSSIIPDLKVAHFSCTICGNTETVTVDRGRIAEPTARCLTCNTTAWQLVHNRCVFADKQLVRLQETPDEVPAGQTPASVVTFCFDDLVDQVQPGEFLLYGCACV